MSIASRASYSVVVAIKNSRWDATVFAYSVIVAEESSQRDAICVCVSYTLPYYSVYFVDNACI